MDFMYILGQKEAIWITLFSILSDGGAPQTSQRPGKLFPFPPPSTGLSVNVSSTSLLWLSL